MTLLVNKKQQVVYARTGSKRSGIPFGKGEAWIWWYEPAKQFVITVRKENGKIHADWLGRFIFGLISHEEVVTGPEAVDPNVWGTASEFGKASLFGPPGHDVWKEMDGVGRVVHRSASQPHLRIYVNLFDDETCVNLNYRALNTETSELRMGTVGLACDSAVAKALGSDPPPPPSDSVAQ